MSFLAHLVALRQHGEWADRRLLDAALAARAPLAVRELAHIRGAQELWLARIEGRGATIPAWPDLSVQEVAAVGTAMDAAWRAFFHELSEDALDRAVAYRNLAATGSPASVDYMLWQWSGAPAGAVGYRHDLQP